MTGLTIFWLWLLASAVAMLVRIIKLPYTIALVLAGLLVGGLGWLPGVRLEPDMLLALFLPPLLFEAGINVDIRLLKRDAGIIGVLAVVGTIICAAVVAAVLHWLLALDWLLAALIGVIIAPTDPISVVAMFRQLGVDKRLTTIVEAESLFNDGVAVVLYSVVAVMLLSGEASWQMAITLFVSEIVGGILVGFLVGGLTSFVTRRINDHLLEITLTTLIAWGAYLLATSLHVSGVVAVVVASLVTGRWLIHRGMSPQSRLAVNAFWEYLAFAVNSIVFLLVGIQMTGVDWQVQLAAIAAVIAALLLARTVAVGGCMTVLAGFGKTLPLAWQTVLVWGGLRGALSMAMALSATMAGEQQPIVLTLTFAAVLFTLLGQGLTIEPLVKRLLR